MNYRLCKYCLIIVILSFALRMTGIAATGILRFVPTVSYLFNLVVFVSLWFSGVIKRDKLSGIITLWTIYVLINTLFVPNNAIGRVMTILESLYWVSTYFITQYLTSFSIHPDKRERWVLIVFYFIAGLALYSMVNGADKYNEDGILIAKNVIFYPVLMVPWLSSIPSVKRKWIAMSVLIMLTFFSLKRSALIIILVAFALMLMDKGGENAKSKTSSKLLVFFLLAGIIWYLGFSPSSPLADVQSRFRDIDEDNGNGRIEIYAMVTAAYDQLPTVNKVIGAGYKQVQNKLTGGALDSSLSAHNDFLEVLYDYGVLGEVIFALIILKILLRSVQSVRKKERNGIPMLISFFTMFLMCLLSNLIIYPTYFLFLTSFWAFSENRYRISQ